MARAKPVPPARPAASASSWLPLLGLCVLPLLAYANSFDGGLVLDSKQLILSDPRVKALRAENLGLILRHSYWWPYGESGLYRPVTTLTYLFNYAVLGNGPAPFGYHAVNLALHLLNCALVFLVFQRLLNRRIAFMTAAVWSVLPLSVEAVTNIPGRADLLAAASVLAGILAYARSRDATGGRRAAYLALVGLAGVLGNFSKESAVVLLPILLLLEWTLWRSAGSLRASWRAVAALAPALLLMLLTRAWVFAGTVAPEFAYVDNPIAHADFWTGRLTALQVAWRYLALVVWPWRLSNDYSYPQIPLAENTLFNWSLVLLALAGCGVAAWRSRRRGDALFAAGFAVIAFLPIANLLFATGTIMAERLLYLPSLGLVALFVLLLTRGLERQTAVIAVLSAAVVLGFGVRTYARNRDWRSDVVLWQSAVAAVPNSAKAHRGLAEAIYDADPEKARLDLAIAHAERSVSLLEGLEDRFNAFQDHRQAAAYHLDRANLQRGRGASEPEAQRSLHRARQLLDRSLAIFEAGAAGRTDVNHAARADVYRLRAAADLGLADYAAAARTARQSIGLAPMHPLAYQLEAEALLRLDRFDEAAVSLGTGALVTGDQQLGTALIDLYRSASDPGGCAVVTIANAPALNPKCPVVRTHVCDAARAARGLLRQAGSDRLGSLPRVTGAFGCPSD